MKVVSPKKNFVYINTERSFRDDKVVIYNKPLFVHLRTLLNPYYNYKVITDQLSAGSHTFNVKAVDDLNNESGVISSSVTISDYTFPPRFVEYSYVDRHHIKLEWTEPQDGAPDNYVVYSNSGSGTIDTSVTYDVLDGSVTSVTYNLTDGDWKFRIEAISSGTESDTKFTTNIKIPRSALVPPKAFDNDVKHIGLTAENVNVGKLKVTFVWPYGSVASKFRIYHDNGTGTVDYSSYIEFDRQNGIIQTHTTGQIYTGSENQDFTIVIRAVTEDDVEESNTVEHTVTLDGVAPGDAENLTIGTTF